MTLMIIYKSYNESFTYLKWGNLNSYSIFVCSEKNLTKFREDLCVSSSSLGVCVCVCLEVTCHMVLETSCLKTGDSYNNISFSNTVLPIKFVFTSCLIVKRTMKMLLVSVLYVFFYKSSLI